MINKRASQIGELYISANILGFCNGRNRFFARGDNIAGDDRASEKGSTCRTIRQCPTVVVARGEPLTASANSTPFPSHPIRCTPPPTRSSLPLGPATPFPQRPPAQTPQPCSSPFARRIRGHCFGRSPGSPEMQFRSSFCRGPSLRALFPLLMVLRRLLLSWVVI